MPENKYKVFVINLERSVARWQKIKNYLDLQKLQYERFSAIDGMLVSDEFLNKYYSQNLNKEKYYTSLNKSEIACYISHLKVCEKIIEDNLDYAIVLEDDVILNANFHLIPYALNSITQKWSYIKLIAPFKDKRIISRSTVAFTVNNSCEIEDYYCSKDSNQHNVFRRSQNLKIPYLFELVCWNKLPTGTQAYAITRDGAIEFLKKRSVFYRPIDVDLQFVWEHNLDVIGLMPFCCELSDANSEIGSRKNYRPHFLCARLLYKFKYALYMLYYKASQLFRG